MGELANMAQNGHRAVLLYLVQRTDCSEVALASDIDPNYAKAYVKAQSAGLETLCYGTHITPKGISLANPLALIPPAL